MILSLQKTLKTKTSHPNTALFKDWFRIVGMQTVYRFNVAVEMKSNSFERRANFIRQLIFQTYEKFNVYYNYSNDKLYDNKSVSDFIDSIALKPEFSNQVVFVNESYTEMTKRLKLFNRAVIIIDSLDSLNFKVSMLNLLIKEHPDKIFVILREPGYSPNSKLITNVKIKVHGSIYLDYKIFDLRERRLTN